MEFDERLKRAIDRGTRRREKERDEALRKQLDEAELKRLHSKIRLELSERIETCIKRLVDHFPGFEMETIFGERGWGAACYRDDIRLTRGWGKRIFSRLEIVVRPLSQYHLVDVAAKGTVFNKELFERKHYEPIQDTDTQVFTELIDRWVLEYAELFAANQVD